MTKIPTGLKPLLWSYNLRKASPARDKKHIIINVINYGSWKQWQGLIKLYGKRIVKQTIEETPASEFRPKALKLISLVLGIKKTQHASRSIAR